MWIFRKSRSVKKTSTLGQFDPLFSKKREMGFFPEKSGSVTFENLSSPNFMQKIRQKKNNEPILRKVRHARTHGQTDMNS